MYKSGGWGERREYLEWQLASSHMSLLVGLRNGAVVATGLAVINGPVGWIGSIFVDVSMRSRGYGRALTDAACALVDAAGCRTQALIASPFGKPLYDKMGFRVDEYYQILEAGPIANAPTPPPGRILRPMGPMIWSGSARSTGRPRARTEATSSTRWRSPAGSSKPRASSGDSWCRSCQAAGPSWPPRSTTPPACWISCGTLASAGRRRFMPPSRESTSRAGVDWSGSAGAGPSRRPACCVGRPSIGSPR